MGIKFTCPACGGVLNVKSELAGKRGRCPKCQAKINIPLEAAAGEPSAEAPSLVAGEAALAAPAASAPEAAASPPAAEVAAAVPAVAAEPAPSAVVAGPATSAAENAIDPIAEAPALEWYAVPPGAASQYGPARGEEFRVWLEEGRVTADALVWRQDWPDWKRAGMVFPQLEVIPSGATAVAAPSVAAPPIAAAVVAAPVVAAPAAGSTPLPTAPTAMPMMSGGPPVAQPAFGMAPGMPGPYPTAAPIQSDSFPIAGEEPAGNRAGRGKAYRPRSNTGPIIAIVVLLVAMIPLSYFVWKVVSEQIGSEPAQTVTGPEKTKQ